MKKTFFIALTAVFAVGGAYAMSMRTEGNLYTATGEDPTILCQGDEAACSTKYGNIQVSTTPVGTPGRVLFNLAGSGYTVDPD